MVFRNRTDARRQLACLVRELGLDRPVVLGMERLPMDPMPANGGSRYRVTPAEPGQWLILS